MIDPKPKAVLYLTEADVLQALTMPVAIERLRAAFADWRAGLAGNQVRRRMLLPSGCLLHSMAGWHGKYFATKVYSTHPKYGAWFFVHLFDAETGRPLAILEANHLGQIRTGAASGLATDLLANPDARTVAILGSGFQARSQVEAIRTVRPSVQNVLVWSRSEERRTRFATEVGGIACPTAELAVRNAEIVCTATYSRQPILDVAWLAPGTHINAIGSNHPDRREIPGELVHRADMIVADSIEACAVEAGDLILADVDWNQVVELRFVERSWRPQAITLFKSVGLGLEDSVAAAYVYEHYTGSRAS